jgi:ubiquinone/menaquinone biosynthesis C-methylase UbiE
MGTPTIHSTDDPSSVEWGEAALQILSDVEAHPSQGSRSYYVKYFRQYFDTLHRCLRELWRVLRPTGSAYFVVQESYCKEILVELPTIVVQMAERLGWRARHRLDYPVKVTKAAVNSYSHAWRSNFGATESVLKLEDAR